MPHGVLQPWQSNSFIGQRLISQKWATNLPSFFGTCVGDKIATANLQVQPFLWCTQMRARHAGCSGCWASAGPQDKGLFGAREKAYDAYAYANSFLRSDINPQTRSSNYPRVTLTIGRQAMFWPRENKCRSSFYDSKRCQKIYMETLWINIQI